MCLGINTYSLKQPAGTLGVTWMLMECKKWVWQIFQELVTDPPGTGSSVRIPKPISIPSYPLSRWAVRWVKQLYQQLWVILSCLFTILDSDYLERWKKPSQYHKVACMKGRANRSKRVRGAVESRRGAKEVIVNSVHTAGEQGELQKHTSRLELIRSPNSRNPVRPFVDAEFLLTPKAAVPPLPLPLPVWCTAWEKMM